MSTLKTLLCGVALGLSALLAGCNSGPHAKPGYSTYEKDGRLYVFIWNSAEDQMFKRTGEIGKAVTRIAAGPGGMTIIAPDGAIIDKFMGKKAD